MTTFFIVDTSFEIPKVERLALRKSSLTLFMEVYEGEKYPSEGSGSMSAKKKSSWWRGERHK